MSTTPGMPIGFTEAEVESKVKRAVTQLDKVKALTAALEAVVKANDADMNDHCIQERIEERLDIVSEKLVNAINEL
jgi:hypothetical protein